MLRRLGDHDAFEAKGLQSCKSSYPEDMTTTYVCVGQFFLLLNRISINSKLLAQKCAHLCKLNLLNQVNFFLCFGLITECLTN